MFWVSVAHIRHTTCAYFTTNTCRDKLVTKNTLQATRLYTELIIKFKKEVGITIKSKETSRKLANYEITGYPLYKLHWLPFVSVHTNLQDLIPTLAT